MTGRIGKALLGVLAVYLVVRGIVELFVIDYHDPASYRHAWGGPSLVGVLAVHSGPGLLLIGYAVLWLRRSHAKSDRS